MKIEFIFTQTNVVILGQTYSVIRSWVQYTLQRTMYAYEPKRDFHFFWLSAVKSLHTTLCTYDMIARDWYTCTGSHLKYCAMMKWRSWCGEVGRKCTTIYFFPDDALVTNNAWIDDVFWSSWIWNSSWFWLSYLSWVYKGISTFRAGWCLIWWCGENNRPHLSQVKTPPKNKSTSLCAQSNSNRKNITT